MIGGYEMVGLNGFSMVKKRAKANSSMGKAVALEAQPAFNERKNAAPPTFRRDAVRGIPGEVGRGDWTALLLALMIFFAPALGVPHEYMLQDTLKSIVVASMAFAALVIFFWRLRNKRDDLRMHLVVVLLGLLAVYALSSMIWSHTFLAGVEASRWIVLSVVAFLALNSLTRDRVQTLAKGVHFGAVVATVWAVSQFWFDWKGIPQGPPPASTFVNRNFYAEFVACTIPMAAYLLFTGRRPAWTYLLACTSAFVLVGIMMTGTRSAMVSSALSLALVVVVALLYRKQWSFARWHSGQRIIVVAVFLITLVGLGMIKTTSKAYELPGMTAFSRAFERSTLIVSAREYQTGSASVRFLMWNSTLRMIKDRPLSGVGAGAWEVHAPLYQTAGSQLETDYYVHNEFLQLLGEYGLLGWVFLTTLLAYLSLSAWRTLRNKTEEGKAEAPLRAMLLMSLLAFLLVSNAGFPWRMAATGAMFALSLGALAASDARLGHQTVLSAMRMKWSASRSQAGVVFAILGLATTIYVSYYAAESERLIVSATKQALSINSSKDAANPRFDKVKKQAFTDLRAGVDINPHYRKITPMVADEAAKWGDWENATWIWESVLGSRPYVVALMANVARGYIQIGQPEKALPFIARAKAIQPTAASIWGAELAAYVRANNLPAASKLLNEALEKNVIDQDVINNGIAVALNSKDWPMALRLLEMRKAYMPTLLSDTHIRIAQVLIVGLANEKDGLPNYNLAMKAMATPQERVNLLASLPPHYVNKLGADYAALGIPPDVVARLAAPRVVAPTSPAASAAAAATAAAGFKPKALAQ